MIFKIMKVFDCQDMPRDLRREFFRLWDNKGNDVFVDWTLGDSDDDVSKQIDEWLIANGAESAKDESSESETVLIKYWW